MRVIAISSQKGGTGKTTTCHALGTLLAARGRNVLMVDMDPQASLSASCGIQVEDNSLADVLEGTQTLDKILVEVSPRLTLAPSSIDLSYTELILVSKLGRENTLRHHLAKLEGYDYALLDCPPSLGLLTVNCLVAAGEVLIPARPEYLGLRALRVMLSTLAELRQYLNPGQITTGILITHFRARVKHHQEVIEAWRAAGLPVLDIYIHETIKAAEAPVVSQSVADYAPGSPIAAAYTELAEYIDNA